MKPFMVLAISMYFTASDAAPATVTDSWGILSVDRAKEESESLGEYERVSVHFTNGRVYEIPLYRASPIVVLRGSDGVPFLLSSGADCNMCDENNTLRFFLLGEKEMKGSGKRHAYPGSLTDYMSPQLLEKTRTFYGHCLEEPNDVVIWFQEYVGEDGKWQKQNSVARMTKNGETLAKLPENGANLPAVVERTKTGSCTELPGVEGTVEP